MHFRKEVLTLKFLIFELSKIIFLKSIFKPFQVFPIHFFNLPFSKVKIICNDIVLKDEEILRMVFLKYWIKVNYWLIMDSFVLFLFKWKKKSLNLWISTFKKSYSDYFQLNFLSWFFYKDMFEERLNKNEI